MSEAIELRENNLYADGQIIVFDEGDEMLERIPLEIESSEEDKWHTVVAGDRLDLLAYKYWNKFIPDASKYWWVIADANQDVIDNPLDLTELVGTDLFIPDILRVRTQT